MVPLISSNLLLPYKCLSLAAPLACPVETSWQSRIHVQQAHHMTTADDTSRGCAIASAPPQNPFFHSKGNDASRQTNLASPGDFDVNSVIRPQLCLERQEGQQIRSASDGNLNLVVKERHAERRGGFDSVDFRKSENASSRSEDRDSLYLDRTSLYDEHQMNVRELLYTVVDSVPAAVLLGTLMVVDFCLFLVSFLFLLRRASSSRFEDVYHVIDWITAVLYFLEVTIRMYCYGPDFYFRGILRSLEYFVSLGNAIFILANELSGAQWLLVIRFIRILRIVTSAITWRERQFKWKTRQELEHLAELLSQEKSNESKLTKWRIEPEAIAVGDRAGQGGFGTVFSGLFRGTLVAVKQISYPEGTEGLSIEDEAITLVNLRHPNVVLFMGFVHEPSKLWIVTEYCSRGSLRDILDDKSIELTEGRILKLALGAARGLAYLHGQEPPVLHLDLKTSNVLISSGWDAKLGDFGLSRSMDKIENDWFSGTMQYAAPEILEANAFSTAADIYSFGICLWEMAAREVPFQDLSPMSVLWGVVKLQLRPSLQRIRVANDYGISTPQEEDAIKKSENQCSGICSGNCSDLEFQDPERRHGSEAHASLLRAPSPIPTERELIRTSPADLRPAKTLSRPKRFSAKEMLSRDLGNGPGAIVGRMSERKRPLENRPDGAVDAESPSGLRGAFHPAKKTSTVAARHRRGKSEVRSHLTGLSRKVTATIEMLDDRPPMMKKKEEDGSREAAGDLSIPCSAEFEGPSDVHSRRGRALPNKTSVRPVRKSLKGISGSTTRYSHLINNSRETVEQESDPFGRRLESVSRNGKQGMLNSGNDFQASRDLQNQDSDEQLHSLSDTSPNQEPDPRHPQPQLPKEYANLIQKCWAHDPKERPTAGEIVWRLVILIDSQMRDK